MLVSELLDKLSEEYIYDLAMEWDNVGLLFGSRKREVKKVLTSLNIDLDTCKKAVELNCNVIVSHHPLLSFKPLQAIASNEFYEGKHSIIMDYYEGELIEYIIKNDLNVIALHTNADFSDAAMGKWIADKLGYKVVSNFVDDTGVIVEINDTMDNVLNNLKAKCQKTITYVGDLEKQIERAVIIGGSGGSFVSQFLYLGHDLLLTGDVSYHNYHDVLMQGNGACIADIGHYMEVVFVNNVLKNIEVDWVAHEINNFIKEF